MKKICLLLGIAFLFQSCFSYKPVAVAPKTMVLGQEYKIERNNKTTKPVVYTRNADSAIFVMRNGVEEQIPVKDITSARVKKFSLLKTTGCFILSLFAFTALLVYGMGDYDSE